MKSRLILNLVLLVAGSVALSDVGVSATQKFAARVVKRNRYATGDAHPDPNQVAKPAMPSSNSGPMEEDFGPSTTGKKNNPKPVPIVPQAMPKAVEEIPPTPAPPRDLPKIPKSRDEGPSPRLPPEFRGPDPEEESQRAGDIEEDGGIGFSLGIGFGAQKFSGTLGLIFPIYKWLAWNVTGAYETWADDEDKQTRYGPETSLMLRLQTRLPITPYAGAGVGYDHWTRTQKGEKFDDAGSTLALYYVGISIPMAKHLAIDISETWRTYLETPPRRFDDHSKRERYGSARFDVGLSVHF